MKLLTNLENLLVFDLTKLGSAYQIINSFVDDESIHVFEISPIGSQAVLILMSKDLILLQLVHNQSLSLCKSEILVSAIIEAVDSKILDPYLSQQSAKLQTNILVLETNSISSAYDIAKQQIASELVIVDFRAIRTSPPNLIITATCDSLEKLNVFMNQDSNVKMTLIPKIENPLKSYFEILS